MQKYSLILIVCFGMDKRNVALFSSCFLICQGGNPSYKNKENLGQIPLSALPPLTHQIYTVLSQQQISNYGS